MIMFLYVYFGLGVLTFIFKMISFALALRVINEPGHIKLKKYIKQICDKHPITYTEAHRLILDNTMFIKENPYRYAAESILLWPKFVFLSFKGL